MGYIDSLVQAHIDTTMYIRMIDKNPHLNMQILNVMSYVLIIVIRILVTAGVKSNSFK
jgi:hypothetical protein